MAHFKGVYTESTMADTIARASQGKQHAHAASGSVRAAQEAAKQAVEEARSWKLAQQEVVSMLEKQNEDYTNDLWEAQVRKERNLLFLAITISDRNLSFLFLFLQRERDRGGSNAIRAIARQREAHKKCAELESKLAEARDELKEAANAFDEATVAYQQCSKDLEGYNPTARIAQESELQEARRRAQIQVDREKKRVESSHFRGQFITEETDQQHAQITTEYGKRLEESKRTQEKLRPRIQKEAERAKSVKKFSEQFQENKKQSRLKSILELKDNTEAALQQVRSQNYLRKKKDEELKKQQERRAKQLRKQGQNPYEVFRKEKINVEFDKQKQNIQTQIAASKFHLAAQVAEEEDHRRRREEAERLIQERSTASHGTKSAQEEKIERLDNYMESKTISGEKIVDPGGRSHGFYPSEIVKTERAPPKIGLGTLHKDDPEKINTLAKKHGLDTIDSMQETIQTKVNDGTLLQRRPEKTVSQKELSNLEKKMIRDARERQRQNICRPQVVMGKTYEKAGFTSSPAAVEFRDYDPDNLVPLARTFTLTNTSLSFNSFKVLPLPDSIRDLFKIEFKPPGRMSAGISCKIKVTFHPRVPQDINSFLDIHTSISKMSIPLVANYAKAKPVIRTPVVDVGHTTRGSQGKGFIKVVNEGARAITFHTEIRTIEKHGEDSNDKFSAPPSSHLKGYGETYVPIHFSSPGIDAEENAGDTPKDFAAKAAISFDPVNVGKDAEGLEDPVELLVKAKSLPLPLYLIDCTLDIKTCMKGKPYRVEIPVLNRGTVSYKTQIKFPPKIREMGLINICSTFGFVQPVASDKVPTRDDAGFVFSVGLTLPEESVEFVSEDDAPESEEEKNEKAISGRYYCRIKDDRLTPYLDKNTNLLTVPFTLVSDDVPLPVEGFIEATLAPGALQINPQTMEFGSCVIGQNVSREIKLTNCSPIAVRFGVVETSSNFFISPSSGFGTLLPGEQATYEIIFAPKTREDIKETIKFQNTLNTVCSCRCHGKGLKQQVRLSHRRVIMPAVAIGEECSSTVNITNVEEVPLNLKVLAPPVEASQITIYPSRVISLQPSKQVSLDFQVKVEDWYADNDGTDPKDSQHRTWLFGIAAQRADTLNPMELMSRWQPTLKDCVGVEVGVNIVPKSIEVTPRFIDFGQLAIGDETEVVVNVRYVREVGQTNFVVEGISPTGPFSLVNAPRTISFGKSCNVKLAFRPGFARIYEETIYVRDSESGSRCRLHLKGEGKSPILSMEPENGVVDFANVCVGCLYSKQVKVSNSSYFSVPVEVLAAEVRWIGSKNVKTPCCEIPVNKDGSPVLECSPTEAIIPPHEERTFIVTFKTTSTGRDGQRLRAQFSVKPQQGAEFGESISLPMSVEAVCWEKYVFAHSLQSENKTSDNEASDISCQQSLGDIIDWDSLMKANKAESEEHTREVHVSASSKQDCSGSPATFRIGCTDLPDDASLDKCSFEIIVPEECKPFVVVEPSKGELKKGETMDVRCTVLSPAKSLLSADGASGSLLRLEDDGKVELLQHKIASCTLQFTGSVAIKNTESTSINSAFQSRTPKPIQVKVSYGIPHQPYE